MTKRPLIGVRAKAKRALSAAALAGVAGLSLAPPAYAAAPPAHAAPPPDAPQRRPPRPA